MSVRPDVAVAARLAPTFQLNDVIFAALEGRMMPSSASVDTSNIVLEWHLAPVQIQWGAVEEQVRAVVPVRLMITCNERPFTEIFLAARADYRLRAGHSWPDPADTDHFVGITAFMHVWPYVRAEVQSLTSKLAIPVLTLPILLSGDVSSRVTVTRATGQSNETGRATASPKLPAKKKKSTKSTPSRPATDSRRRRSRARTRKDERPAEDESAGRRTATRTSRGRKEED